MAEQELTKEMVYEFVDEFMLEFQSGFVKYQRFQEMLNGFLKRHGIEEVSEEDKRKLYKELMFSLLSVDVKLF